MPGQPAFLPNIGFGPCLYCDRSLDQQPEEFLRCELCRRSAHIACLKTGIPEARLLGDNFFVFSCSECNNHQAELVLRAQMSIVQALALVLYNLHCSHFLESRNGYFHYKDHVHKFIMDNWDKLYNYDVNQWYRFKEKTKPCMVSGHLSQFPQHFQVDKFGKRGWYKLIHPKPPAQIFALHQRKKSSESDRQKSNKKMKIEIKTLSQPLCTIPSKSITSMTIFKNDSSVKPEPSEDSSEGFEDASSTGSWFSIKDYIKPDRHLPTHIFENEDDLAEEVQSNIDVEDTTESNNESLVSETEEEENLMKDVKPVILPSLFTRSDHAQRPCEDSKKPSPNCNFRPLTYYEERKLLNKLNRLNKIGKISSSQYLFRRKLIVRQEKREHNIPVFDIDGEVDFYVANGRLQTTKERLQTHIASEEKINRIPLESSRILDRFHQNTGGYYFPDFNANTSFRAKLLGCDAAQLSFIHSPYTLRKLKPYIFRDTVVKPLKLLLLEEIRRYPNRNNPNWVAPRSPPIDYRYVTPKHIPAMNRLARQFFWPGIELSEVLQYPDHTCVVLYGRLVIGFGVLVPDTRPNESYLSFLFVHPEFRRAGIAKFILYHLIQTSPGKDLTLHVSATNAAVIMYQEFGFKVEEFLKDFYDKYLPYDSHECKHAMFMRLLR